MDLPTFSNDRNVVIKAVCVHFFPNTNVTSQKNRESILTAPSKFDLNHVA